MYNFYSTMRYSFAYWEPIEKGEGGLISLTNNYSYKSNRLLKYKKYNW